MKERLVRFTATDQGHVKREQKWWNENRDYRDMFVTELEAAVRILALLPGAGTLYTQSQPLGLRRLYVEKLGCHLYYTFNDDEVLIRAMWGARRERGPTLR